MYSPSSFKTRPPREAVLPTDPKWILIETTDGDSRRLPTNTIENPDPEGNVNFMQPVPVNHGVAVKWRIAIGQALAEMLKYPDVESKKWVLKDWPEGYAFYDHHKGPKESPRHDLYLVGSKIVGRFRSPQEFIPHAYWLMTNNGQDRSKCECKYCAKKPQREISDAFGLSQWSASQARFTELPRRENRRRALPIREGRVFATVRRVPKPVSLPKGPQQHVDPEREKDLRALLVPKTLGERRWAREGELVWVRLDHPIPVTESAVVDDMITYWPGIIEEVTFKAEVHSRRTNGKGLQNGQHEATSPSTLKGEDADPWTITHKFIYKIMLLVVSKTILFGSDHILPYQAHAPDADLLRQVQSVVFYLDDDVEDPDRMVLPSDEQHPGVQAEENLFKRFQAFDPFPQADPHLLQIEERRRFYETAAGAFATAIQIASRLSLYYTPCDKWDYKMHQPSDYTEVWSTSQGQLTPAEEQALMQISFGRQATIGNGITTQSRYQGLWWGPERIWMGDLVRLKLGRYQLAPDGTDVVKKPSGAGKCVSSLDGNELASSHLTNGSPSNSNTSHTNGVDTEMKTEDDNGTLDVGAAPRSLFLRIDGIFVAQFATEDERNTVNECRMCGMLYELADDDWEPEGEEYGPPTTPLRWKMPNGTQPNGIQQESMEGTMPTPLRAVMPTNGIGTTIANAINSMASDPAPAVPNAPGPMPTPPPPPPPPLPSSSSFSLFAPNPDLLSEPSGQDVDMADGTQANHNTESISSAAAFSSQSQSISTAIPSSSHIPTYPAAHPVNQGPSDASVSNLIPALKAEGTTTTATTIATTTTSSMPPLSGPLKSAESAAFPMPPAPSSLLRFRPILREGHEVVLPLTTLAGRYYPGLLSNPLLQPRVRAALENPAAREAKAIRALEGLVPGAYNSVDAALFLSKRSAMLREAERVAWKELVGYWRRRAEQERNAIVVDE